MPDILNLLLQGFLKTQGSFIDCFMGKALQLNPFFPAIEASLCCVYKALSRKSILSAFVQWLALTQR